LFTGGLLPGLVVGLILCSVVWFRARRDDQPPARVSARVIGRSLVVALPALALPFVIRGAVVGGIATATEVSTIGIVYSVIAGLFIYRQFDTRRLLPMLVQTASLTGAILLIVGAATAMAWAITSSGFSHVVAGWITAMPGGAVVFMVISIVLFIVLGSILEGIPVIVLFGPLLFPMAKQVGIHEVHYAMVAILAMGIGLFAPPFGVGYYVACAIARCNPDAGMRHIWRYLAALVVGLAIVAAIPWISIGFL
jgi:tripartite ATP-independent transporter DctM subunit